MNFIEASYAPQNWRREFLRSPQPSPLSTLVVAPPATLMNDRVLMLALTPRDDDQDETSRGELKF